MASVMPGLLPDSSGVQFTARPALRTRDCSRNTNRNGRSSSIGSASDSGILSPNASLSSIEIEALLREKVRAKSDSIIQAFKTYDVDQTSSVTKGEFRRVLEAFCSPLTTDQFEAVLAKVSKNPNGTVRYADFLDKFHSSGGNSPGGRRQVDRITNGVPKFPTPPTPKEINVDMIEKLLKEKIEGNLKSVVKGLQLFDYNRDGRIQRHEMRRVIENYCFKLSDSQYDKLWQRYDFHHTGMVNYKDFLSRLGVSVLARSKPPQEGAMGALNWQQNTPNPHLRNFKQRQEDEQMLQAMSFREIEIEFRKRMRDNYVNLKKAFMVFDTHLDGFVSVDDLQSILTQFTIPMSKQLFAQMMEKCGVRATGRIGWEDFLEKFQEPMMTGNGQTLPIRPNHKFFPVKEGIQTVEVDEIWKLLYKHVQSNYGSFKQAFLQFDVNRKGRVSRMELRNILEKFHIRLQDDQFKQLMEKIDPFHTNNISYQKFLELFEEKDSWEGHKWLNSVHRVNEHNKPAILAWETVEDILKEKITEYWRNVSAALLDYDYKGNGHISHKNLRKVIDNYVLPVSDEHFQSMLCRCEDRTDSQVNYVEFLEKLKVDVKPSDLNGLSTQIFNGSIEREFKRQEDLHYRNSKISGVAHGRTNEMSADEVVARLKDRMAQHNQDFRQAFLAYDRRGKGSVSKKDFRQVLMSFGLAMSDEQFNILVSKLNFNESGQMQYSDFISNFNDPRHGGPGEEIIRSGNHRVNPIRGDQFGMSIEEVERKLASKLRENFANLRSAFYKFDDNHKGALTKDSMRRLLDSFMCFLTDEQFDAFCNKHGITKSSKITYPEFLDRFEVRDTVEGHKWLKSVHRFNETQPTPEMTAGDAFDIIKRKAHQQFKDLSQAFIKIGTNKSSGVLKRRDLRQLLLMFVMPVPDTEFQKLWLMFDPENVGYITHDAFLQKIGASEFTPGDLFGMSSKIIDHSRQFLEDHNEEQQQKHERITQLQANRTGFMTVEDVEQALKDKIRDNYDDFNKAFRKYDTEKRGSLSISEVQKVLIDFNLFLDDDQFFTLLDRCGLTTRKSRLNYEQFLAAFEEGRKSSYGQRKGDVQIEEQPNLTNQEAEHRLRELVASQVEVLEREHSSTDLGRTSLVRHTIEVAENVRPVKIPPRRVPKAFEGQEEKIIQQQLEMGIIEESRAHGLHLYAFGNSFNYGDNNEEVLNKDVNAILDEHVALSEDAAQTSNLGCLKQFNTVNCSPVKMAKLQRADPDLGIVIQWLEENRRPLRDKTVSENIQRNKACGIYFLFLIKSLKMFFSLLKAFLFQIQIFCLFKQHNVFSAYGNLNITCLQDSERWLASLQKSIRSQTPHLMAIDEVEEKLREAVMANPYNLTQAFQEADFANMGVVSKDDFKSVLNKQLFRLSDEQYEKLWPSLSINEFGNINYREFVKRFSSEMKPSCLPPPTPLQRSNTVLNTSRRPDSMALRRSNTRFDMIRPGAMSRSQSRMATPLVNAEVAENVVKNTIYRNWKQIQQMCRQKDVDNCGTINVVDLKEILVRYGVDLSSQEFLDLLTKYDLKENGQFCYSDFLRHFILNLKPQDEPRSLLARRKIATPKVARSAGSTNTQFFSAMMRIQDTVSSNWKEMRRQFRALDPLGSGMVDSVDFRYVLRLFSVNLDEDEFYHVMSYYDKHMDGKISYNDFIRAYLHSS
ncbi:EF-hand calcium-binding domain-containing protein 6-like [Mercenaria mercenaria]|uniref:EF-hand calcium-binding domain-containing protein 6-like n=1 Tax=Mercenaria mercenaria TaxID=6596 RepID=UPI00234E5442|nr:EF-hand calcium-binding domain-containing protein 6-like [Mercenaria mercenaria]